MSVLAEQVEIMATPDKVRAFDAQAIRQQFPALAQSVHNKPLVYLDNAATTQKPQSVIDAVRRAYEEDCANVHRGVHILSQRATLAYEGARSKIRGYLNARSDKEIIFVRGTTEAINLVAQCYGTPRLGSGDEILITGLEHHSNIVPWQMVCERTGAKLVVAPIDDRGALLMNEFEQRLTSRTKMVAVVHYSNALGTINPVRDIVDLAHTRGCPVLLDGAQAVPHTRIDVQELGCDFYAFSGHKLFGPTGIGVLYGRQEILEEMPPYQGGGDMIASVTFEKTTYAELPSKFEAGTPHIAGVMGLGAAIDFVKGVDFAGAKAHEDELLAYGTERLTQLPGIQIVGTAPEKTAVLSFVMDAAHPHDIGTIADREGVAIRTGHHCAQPVMQRLGVPATARASFSFYNTFDEIDALVAAIERVQRMFA